ncbi:MAG: hypothetical protein K5900_00620 [Butyrivibrio sp.]|nr:hypothetical protein [Butyrivibrio sp.]
MRLEVAKKALSVTLAAAIAFAPAITSMAATTAATTTSSSSSTEAVVETVVATPTVAGTKSTIAGAFTTKTIAAAVTTPKAEVATSLGLAAGETAKVVTWDISAKKSPLAYAALNNAAAALGVTVGPTFEFDINKVSKGKVVALASGAIQAKFTIPAKFRTAGADYKLIRVTSAGTEVIPVTVSADGTSFTATIPAGNAAYALAK